MRKTVLAALLAVLASAANAAWLDVTPHAGYTSVSMGQLNRTNTEMFGYYPTNDLTLLSDGFIAGLDLTTQRLLPWPWLSVGLRSEYLQTNLAEMKSDQNVPSYSNSDELQYTDQGKMVNALLGAVAETPFVAKGLSLGLGAWIGAAYGDVDQHVGYDVISNGVVQNGYFKSIFLTGEMEARLHFKLTDRMGLSASAGWRWADAGTVKDSKGTPLYANYDYWVGNGSHPVDADFSGATAQGSLNLSF